MRCRLTLGLLISATVFLPAYSQAQTDHNEIRESGLYFHYVQHSKQVAGKVFDVNGAPVAHAQVEITNNAGAAPQILQSDDEGVFQTQYQFNEMTDQVRNFVVVLKVSKKGFRVSRRRWEIADNKIEGIPVTLRPIQPENPALLPQAEMIKLVAPRLRQLSPADGLNADDQKNYARGVQEFLDRNHSEQSLPHFAKVAKANPSCLRCRTMLALAEMSWGDWDGASYEVRSSANAYVADKKLGRFEPLFVQGELSAAQGDPERAVSFLSEAVKFAPNDSLGLRELGRALCLDLDWYDASEMLKKAVAAGAGPDAQLQLAEALTWSATPKEAEDAFQAYASGRDLKTLPPRAKLVWSNIQAKQKDDTAVVAAVAKAKRRGVEPLDYINHPPVKTLSDFVEAPDQSMLASVLDSAGKNVTVLFASLPNIVSTENVHQERLTRDGATASAEEFKYRYLLMSEQQQWGPTVEEHRATFRGRETTQLGSADTYMLTSGFVSAPLVFHPAYQPGSKFRLLGTQQVQGRRTYVVAYAQDPGKTRICGGFQVGKTTVLTYTQGMAWIDAENFEILRLVSDLLRPVPLLRLEKENTDIDFVEVKFKKPTAAFLLPNDVKVTLEWNGRVLRNKHGYSDFLISNVDSLEKITAPKSAENTPDNAEPPNLPAGVAKTSFAPSAATP